jgi:hypothetical protein
MASIDERSSRSATAGGGVGSEAQEKVTQAAEQAQEKAQNAAARVQQRLREELDDRSTHAAEQINEQAADLRSVGESLRQQGKEGPARAADQLARHAQRVGGYLREKDSDALLADAEDLGRRQPWAVAAGGLVLGFAASRVLKASSGRRYRGGLTVRRPAGVYPTHSAALSNGDTADLPTVGISADSESSGSPRSGNPLGPGVSDDAPRSDVSPSASGTGEV